MLTLRRPPEGGPVPREVVGGTQARHHAGTEHAELPSQHGRRDHAKRRAAVAVALDPPPDAHEQERSSRARLRRRRCRPRRCRSPPRHATASTQPSRRSTRRLRVRVHVDERSVDQPVAIQMTHHGEHADVGAGPQREVRVEHAAPYAVRRGSTTTSALSPSLLHERGEVDVRYAGVRAPHDHELAVHHVQRIGREHPSERRAPRPRPQFAAQIVCSTRAAPISSNIRQVRPSAASDPADELYR